MTDSNSVFGVSSRATEHKTKRAIRSIDVASAALYGAVLWGAIYLVIGLFALIIAGITTNEGGPLSGFVRTILYFGIGIIPLLVPVILAIFLGGISGTVAALVYNAVASQTGGIVIVLGGEET